MCRYFLLKHVFSLSSGFSAGGFRICLVLVGSPSAMNPAIMNAAVLRMYPCEYAITPIFPASKKPMIPPIIAVRVSPA